MIAVIITKDSEVSKLQALGVKEPVKEPQWVADQQFRPFSQRDYGHVYKTIVRGSKKRA